MKKYLLLLIVSVAFLLLSAYSYVNAVSNNLADSVFRLHVIANSDSEEDQNLKYKVRDCLINYMNTLTNDLNTKDEVIEIAHEHIDDFKNIAQNVVEENVTPTVQPEVTEEQINSDYVGVEEQESTNTAQTEEEKVIELVKQEYGTDQGISINIANKDGNIYHVSVNDETTTAVLAWYKVDISNKTVTQE